MSELLINFTYVTISLKMSNYNFVHINFVWTFWNGLYLGYMFWMDFLFFGGNFLAGFVFLSSLSMLSVRNAAHTFFRNPTKLCCASSQIKWAPTAKLIKLLILCHSFIPTNMDTNFPEPQTCFSHKMKNVNRHSHQWNIGIKIRSITIILK